MRPWLVPARRASEAVTADQLIATGALGGQYGVDPIDGDVGFRPAGTAGTREIPWWTAEKARIYAVNAYRANPMARAIIDTFVSFCVGDSGVSYQVTNPAVRQVVDQFWTDPKNALKDRQDLMLRSHLLLGESLLEMLTGPISGVVRLSPIEPGRISEVQLRGGNAWWPIGVSLDRPAGGDGGRELSVVEVNDFTGLREGQAQFWASFKTLDTDVRGYSFLGPILDQLDSYDTVLSNLIDRTALARYMVWDVTVEGGQDEVDKFVAGRRGTHIPPSGSVEVHNAAVKWEPKTVSTGAFEDTTAAQSVLTQIAAGSGLTKHWLAEPEGANRATSMTMAEPVRRRVGGVQNLWLGYQAELTRYQVDQAVRARRIPAMVEATDPRTGQTYEIPASQTVTLTGPEIAAADAQITAQVLLNLSTGLEKLQQIGALSPEAARVAAKKAWESYMGIPYTAELDSPEANPDDVATAVDDAQAAEARRRRRSTRGNPETLHHYWTRDPVGLSKWVGTAHPWTELYQHLLKHMDGDVEMSKKTASAWFQDVFGYPAGSRKGTNPVGRG
ncbi:hypothetical protein GCM10023196_035650 [Actinoallomurus vinaceus]|uniref:Portal protein n=1 Tax=Actinoallomurus vinaceus TaxID=1080074 RepID=A0ABP8U8W2_9ACTN